MDLVSPALQSFNRDVFNRIEETWLSVKERRSTVGLDLFSVNRVAVIVGSSRGGTSLLHTLLQRHINTISLDGEHTPYYKLADIGYPAIPSDRVERGYPVDKDRLARLLAASVGTPAPAPNLDDWIDRLLLRLPLQTPLDFDHCRLKEALSPTHNRAELNGKIQGFFAHLDLNKTALDNNHLQLPERELHSPPSTSTTLEEPPYIFPQLYKRPPSQKDLADKVLLLKSSVDAYRLEWLAELFANAQIYIIHATRNPAASINGLIDGWKSKRGFYAHCVGDLAIEGYTDLSPAHCRLWCFDLPPNWELYRDKPLEAVCANQWEQAHQHILTGIRGQKSMRLKYEDLIYDKEGRTRAMDQLCRFLDLGEGGPQYRHTVLEPPIVMASQRPAKNRWRRREEKILAAVDQLDQKLIDEFYGKRSTWI